MGIDDEAIDEAERQSTGSILNADEDRKTALLALIMQDAIQKGFEEPETEMIFETEDADRHRGRADDIRIAGMHSAVTSFKFEAFFGSLILINSAILAADHHEIHETLELGF